ncbi:MAG: DEAD/DEAH box helicase, partial [Proteobacteria bacterium]|nr:DEAD/DEAH box helicase [Pseudomonadota bacterium]
AFLWSINQLVSGGLLSGQTSVLYISPLKALNNDIQRNLIQPLNEIQQIFKEKGEVFPDIRVLTRSGDTPQEDRRKMLRHPPEILITTPESLNLMLSSRTGKEMLYHLSTVIMDEIHAVLGNKRGVHLITAVDRLVRLSGEFQRISLSATLKDLNAVASFVGGFKIKGSIMDPKFEARPVQIIESSSQKKYRIAVRFPKHEEAPVESTIWDTLADEFKDILEKNRSTLFFTNSRRLCEKMTFKINSRAGQPLAYSHHGSLSRELRQNVEQNLKNGTLRAIVATSSLEMGIDIGNLDEVILIQSPSSVSSAIQRVGRAGHSVNVHSRGTIYSPHPQDLISAAVLAKAIDDKNIEPIISVECPLDVLAQILISMTGLEIWDMDELFAQLRTSYPYRNLSREHYDLVLNMLAGRYADSRIRELKPRVSIDRLDNTVQAKKGALLALYMSGGTIPDRGYFQLRHHETNARIGELDEEYVWEAKIGQISTIGTQNWKITKITHNDVFAVPVGSQQMDAPFWIAEGFNRDSHFSNQTLEFLENANHRLKEPEFEKELESIFHLDENAARELIRFLKGQKEDTGSDLPHRHHILLEYVRSGPDGSPGSMLVLHTLWGGQLNRPYAFALEAAWEEKFGEIPEVFPGNDAIVIQLPHKIEPEEILSFVTSTNVESLLKRQLEKSGFFSARFRECSGRALLVIRNKINQRMPLWMTRLKSKKLLENIISYEDFPILLETWRTCLQDEFDLSELTLRLNEMESGVIGWSQSFTSRPSPFAAGMAWNQINQYMYQDDQGASNISSLGDNWVQDLLFSPNLRPAISKELILSFEKKCQRFEPGYAPQSSIDLLDWVKERIAIPENEWEILVLQIKKNSNGKDILDEIEEKLVRVQSENIEMDLIVSMEMVSKIVSSFLGNKNYSVQSLDHKIDHKIALESDNGQGDEEKELSVILGQWLQFYGPRSIEFIQTRLGIESHILNQAIEDLIENRQIISGRLVKNGPDRDLCDSENFEILMRLSRSRAIPDFNALGIEHLPHFLAHIQGLTRKREGIGDLFESLEQLVCLPLPAETWEADILPARLSPYQPSFLDTILQEGDLHWYGTDKKKVTFCFQSDLDFLGRSLDEKNHDDKQISMDGNSSQSGLLEKFFDSQDARYDFTRLLNLTELSSGQLSKKIWNQVWQGKLSNEMFSALRKGIETKYKPPEMPKPEAVSRMGRRQAVRKRNFSHWKGSLPLAGYWFAPRMPEVPEDLLEREEINKDRVRLLLDRYGILFRELLLKESPQFRWLNLFRSLRIMEMTGEILAGHFFKDIPGPQFMSQKAFRILQTKFSDDGIYFMNAIDPASVCGLPIPAVKKKFPKRLSNTYLVFKGPTVMLVCHKNGKELLIHAKPDDDLIVEYLAPLKHLLYRQFMPLKNISIETINGEPADKSEYLSSLKTLFNVLPEFKKVTLYRKLD